MSLGHLYQDVHLLALHYHWNEAEILRMPRGKRVRYLGLLSEHLAESSGDSA